MTARLLLVLIALLLLGFMSATFVVDEREQVVVTQFGKPVGDAIQEPGLYFKIPLIQEINVFPKTLLEWDGDPGQIPTKDKTYLWVDTFARWKIVDPLAFFQTVNNERSAQARLDDIIDPAVRNFVTSYPLIETVRSSNRELDTYEAGLEEAQKDKTAPSEIKVGRAELVKGVLEAAKPKLVKFGIDVVDVQIKRVNYVEQVREAVYGRMIAERRQIAEKFRSEGMGEARKIEGDRERDMKAITSEGYKTAQETRGHADAEAAKIYADAFGRDPEFYSFIRTMELYEQQLGDENMLIMSTDSELFKYMKGR